MDYKIKHIDAIKYIDQLVLENKIKFDAIITDPPYNISKKNNFSTIGRKGIDFGKWDYGFDQHEWIIKSASLVKKGGSIIIFNDWKNMGDIAKTLEKSGFVVKDLIRWVKKNPMPRNINRRYVTDFEFAIWAVKPGAPWTFNNEGPGYKRPMYSHSIVAKSKFKVHPTQKSYKLLEDIIKTHTNQGDLIFDPFMGSGSTGISSLSLNRLFVGTEIDFYFFEKAKEMLSRFQKEKFNNKSVNRSPLYYLGDKYKLFPQLINFFPKKINVFYDIFSGGGTMLSNVKYKKAIYNDKDEFLFKLNKHLFFNEFEDIMKNIQKTINKYNLTNPLLNKRLSSDINSLNKLGYNKLKKEYNDLKDKDTFNAMNMLTVLVIYGFNSQIRFNKENNFNIPVGKQDLNNGRYIIFKKFLNNIKLRNVKCLNKDFRYFKDHKFNKDDFIYLDPPYSISSATYNNFWNKKDDEDLMEWLDYLDSNNIKWALSNLIESKGIKNEKLISWSKKYYCNELKFNYKNSNYQRKTHLEDVEVLITNFKIK